MTQAYNLSQLANFVNSSGQLDASIGLTNTASVTFPSGTLMLFQQTAAPTGWTKQTTHNNKALRVVSGTASSGGSVDFTTVFASGLSTGGTTLSSSQIPAHYHYLANGGMRQEGSVDTFFGYYGKTNVDYNLGSVDGSTEPYISKSQTVGGGGSHNHTLPNFAVQYVDLIIASRN